MLNTYIASYLFSISYQSQSSGNRVVPGWQQVAALTAGLASVIFTLCHERWSLARYGPRMLSKVLSQNLCLRALFVGATISWTTFEVIARVGSIIMFGIGYQAWVFVALAVEYCIRAALISIFVNARLGASTGESVWIRAMRQMLCHEVDVDTKNSSVDRVLLVIFTLFVQV